jgi:hypothetical protein
MLPRLHLVTHNDQALPRRRASADVGRSALLERASHFFLGVGAGGGADGFTF